MKRYFITPTTGFHFNEKQIKLIESKYAAKYLGAFCTKNKKGSWHEMPVDVFYNPNPDMAKGHKHYFGMFYDSASGAVMIMDATSAFSDALTGIVAENGQVVVSGYRHDYRKSEDGTVYIDGGRDYVRCGGRGPLVRVMVTDGEMRIDNDTAIESTIASSYA